MVKPSYALGGHGHARMNEIMNVLLVKPMIITEICTKISMGQKAVRGYLRRMEEAEKILSSPGTDGREKVYRLKLGAMPFDLQAPKSWPRRERVAEPKKRGPKPGTKRPSYADDRKIKSIPAQQIGMQRDPFQALFFGQPQRTSA